jgi:hypothetical protein
MRGKDTELVHLPLMRAQQFRRGTMIPNRDGRMPDVAIGHLVGALIVSERKMRDRLRESYRTITDSRVLARRGNLSDQ